MANRERGEVSINIGGMEYMLVLDMDAMCELEDLFSVGDKEVSFTDVIGKAERGSIRHLRGVWWACLRRHHPKMTLADASQLVQDLGGIAGLQQKLAEVSQAAKPDKRDAAEMEKGAKKRPQKAQVNGTGAKSTSSAVSRV